MHFTFGNCGNAEVTTRFLCEAGRDERNVGGLLIKSNRPRPFIQQSQHQGNSPSPETVYHVASTISTSTADVMVHFSEARECYSGAAGVEKTNVSIVERTIAIAYTINSAYHSYDVR